MPKAGPRARAASTGGQPRAAAATGVACTVKKVSAKPRAVWNVIRLPACAGGAASATSAENGNPPGNSANKVQIRRALRSILSTQDEVWGIMNENSRLIEQFGQLAAVAAAAATSPSSSAGSIELNSAQILAEVDDTLGRYGQ